MADEGPAPTDVLSLRERLLSVATQRVAALRADDVLPGVREVCRGAGVGASAFYRCFDDLTDFHVALVEWIADHATTIQLSDASREEVVTVADAIAHDHLTGMEAASRVATAAGSSVDHQVGKAAADNRMQFLLAALAEGEDEVARAVRTSFQRVYDRLTANEATGIASLAESFGGVVRPPFTAESVAYIVCAVIEGLCLRAMVDPGFDGATVIEDTTRVLFIALLADPGDPEDIDALVGRALDAAQRRREADAS